MNPLSTDAQSVIEAARAGEAPAPEDRERVKAKLMIAVAGGTALAAAEIASGVAAKGAAATAVKAGSLATAATAATGGASAAIGTGGVAVAWGGTIKILAVVGLAAAATTAVVKTNLVETESAPAAIEHTPPAVLQDPQPASAVPAPLVDEQKPEDLVEAEAVAPKEKRETVRIRHRASASNPTRVIPSRDEMTLMQEAVAAEESGNLNLALEKVQEHRRRFFDSQLAEERLAVRISILCRLGRGTEADGLQSAFQSKYTGSYLRKKIDLACE